MDSVWYCKNEHEPRAIVSDGPVQCKECNEQMTNIGWFETDAEGKRTEEQKD